MLVNVICLVSEFNKNLGRVIFSKPAKVVNLQSFARSCARYSSLYRCACCDAFGGVMQDFNFVLSDSVTGEKIGSFVIRSSGFDSDNIFSFYDPEVTLKKCPYIVEKI